MNTQFFEPGTDIKNPASGFELTIGSLNTLGDDSDATNALLNRCALEACEFLAGNQSLLVSVDGNGALSRCKMDYLDTSDSESAVTKNVFSAHKKALGQAVFKPFLTPSDGTFTGEDIVSALRGLIHEEAKKRGGRVFRKKDKHGNVEKTYGLLLSTVMQKEDEGPEMFVISAVEIQSGGGVAAVAN